MKTFAIVLLSALLIPAISLAQTTYSQDFESLPPVDGSLSGDGWLNYGNVFDPGGGYIGGYGPYSAVNNVGNWQDIVTGEGGPAQGAQQIVVYSDYANGEHGNGNWVETNLYQEWTVPAGASGVWNFTFDAKIGNLEGSSTALAFIKTLDPNAGWAMTNFITADMTTTPVTWTGYLLSIDIAGLDNQILQIGFSTTATNYEGCGVFYDNVNFAPDGSTAVENESWGGVKSLFR
ncbi:MAG: hypothetical protein JW958_12100 [Candidatus Eisenbacteria bacterium]|nr:hypothetical protein [Candidatus Eisenbacteria bacterium]